MAGRKSLDELVKISEMASMCGVSRQTLILYDKNGLLKPAYVSETGYRYYSVDQIPYLRHIALLKSLGVTLAELNEYLHEVPAERRPQRAAELLDQRSRKIRMQMVELQRQAEEIDQLSRLFRHVDTRERNAGVPFVEWIDERSAVYTPYPSDQMDPKKLHVTLMKAWRQVLGAEMIPSAGFGSLLKTSALNTASPLREAGSIVLLPMRRMIPGATIIKMPAGEHVVMYDYAMPYDLSPCRKLLRWMSEHHLEPAGEVYSCCLLDAVFHTKQHDADFCRVEIRIRES